MKNLMTAVIFLFVLASLSFFPCSAEDPSLSETRTIPYDASLDTLNDLYGADAFDHAMDHAGSPYYTMIDFYDLEPTPELHLIPGFATYQQTTEYTCGAASALMVLNHFGNHDHNEMQIAEIAEADPSKGISVENLAGFFSGIGYDVEYHADTEKKFASIDEAGTFIRDRIDAGIPVMVSWEDWRGHWLTIIGLDTMGTVLPYDDVVIFADSYDVTDHYQDGFYIYPFGRFYDMWREGPCTEKLFPYEQPFVTARPAEH